MNDNNKARFKPIEIGIEDADKVEVRNGITAADAFVTSGASALREDDTLVIAGQRGQGGPGGGRRGPGGGNGGGGGGGGRPQGGEAQGTPSAEGAAGAPQSAPAAGSPAGAGGGSGRRRPEGRPGQ
jgi:hypothetical protein